MSGEHDHANPPGALQAVVAEAQAGVFARLDVIVRALSHEDWEVRMEAAYCCKRIGFSAALDPLSRMALSDPVSQNRAQAAYGLEGIARPSAVPALARVLDDEEDECRQAARTVLYRIVGMEVLTLLGDEGDECDPTESVRVLEWWAAQESRFDSNRSYALGELAGPEVFIRCLETSAIALPDAYLNLLHDWTGEDFGDAPLQEVINRWERWWAWNRQRYEPGRRYFHGHRVPQGRLADTGSGR